MKIVITSDDLCHYSYSYSNSYKFPGPVFVISYLYRYNKLFFIVVLGQLPS